MLKVISAFGTTRESGHTLIDDLYYYNYLKKNINDYKFYAPSYAVQNLKNNFKGAQNKNIKILSNFKISAGDKLVFLGYSERQLLRFVFIFLFLRCRVTLVATNNFSEGRFKSG